MLDRRVVYVIVHVLYEKRRKLTSLRFEDNIKMDLNVLEWTVWTRFGSGLVPGWGGCGKISRLAQKLLGLTRKGLWFRSSELQVVQFLFLAFPRAVPFGPAILYYAAQNLMIFES